MISNGFTDYNHDLLEVGISNNISLGDPNIITMPARGSYPICAYSNESTSGTSSGHLSLSCKADTPPGRYVIVRTEGAEQQLTICEISVYEKGITIFIQQKQQYKQQKQRRRPWQLQQLRQQQQQQQQQQRQQHQSIIEKKQNNNIRTTTKSEQQQQQLQSQQLNSQQLQQR